MILSTIVWGRGIMYASRHLATYTVALSSLHGFKLQRGELLSNRNRSLRQMGSSASAGIHAHANAMEAIVGPGGVLTDPSDVEPYNIDWLKNNQGSSKLVVLPSSTEHISRIMKYCHQHNLPVVPQGGNTGLVGGSVPVHDEIIINLKRMNKIHSFNDESGVLVCEAGCILQQLDHWLAEKGHMMPLDLGKWEHWNVSHLITKPSTGAKGSCMIGGNVSTSAGGVRFIRYGSLHGNVLGLETVLADGTVLDLLSTNKKDNTGYALKHLFIGSEGTLGIITKVAMHVYPRPQSTKVCVCVCDSFAQVCDLLKHTRTTLGESLSAFEFMDENGIQAVGAAFPKYLQPIQSIWTHTPKESSKFLVLIEASSADANSQRLMGRLEELLEPLLSNQTVRDAIIAVDGTQEQALWNIRENVPVALAKLGKLFKYDVSLPVAEMYTMVEETSKFLSDALLCEKGKVAVQQQFRADINHDEEKTLCVTGFGHMGDGNLHLNILLRDAVAKTNVPDDAALTLQIKRQLNKFVYERCISLRGSISAEHGIGVQKKPFMEQVHSPEVLATMQRMKQLFDPKGLLNPGKVLP